MAGVIVLLFAPFYFAYWLLWGKRRPGSDSREEDSIPDFWRRSDLLLSLYYRIKADVDAEVAEWDRQAAERNRGVKELDDNVGETTGEVLEDTKT